MTAILLGTTGVFRCKPADSAAFNGYLDTGLPEDMPEPNEDPVWEKRNQNYWVHQKEPHEEAIEAVMNDDTLSESAKQEEIEAIRNGTKPGMTRSSDGGPQFVAVGIRPALWVDIGSLK